MLKTFGFYLVDRIIQNSLTTRQRDYSVMVSRLPLEDVRDGVDLGHELFEDQADTCLFGHHLPDCWNLILVALVVSFPLL